MMRVALVLKQDKQEEVENTQKVVVFTVQENKVVGVENETVDTAKEGHLSLWALTKKVNEIYMPAITESLQKLFHAIDVTLMSYEDMAESRIFRNYLVNY
ncbi:MAG: hypothetical protein LUD02_00225 [Tannerellaceae bacterium]|nr:hypothetical protein [Tannerellaceae bacterium]MCD8262763.1 hypothetical protein [Tannerellaceae bacterium]